MKKEICLLLLVLITLTGCFAPHSKVTLLGNQDSGVESAQLEAYDKYGACYLYDETFIEASYANSAGTLIPSSQIVINKRLKILNTKGVEFATMQVPVFTPYPSSYIFKMWDSTGAPVTLNMPAIYEEYRKSGKVVFPNAAPGCEMVVQVKYKFSSFFPSYEHWFVEEIPIHKSRFTFSYRDDLTYNTKLYGPTDKVSESSFPEEKMTTTTWEFSSLMPPVETSFDTFRDSEYPRVALVVTDFSSGYSHQSFNKSWEEVSKQYKNSFFAEHLFASDSKLLKLRSTITDDSDSKMSEAEKLFNWVRDSLEMDDSPLGKINPNKIFRERKGNLWEITYFLQQLFLSADIRSDILITRSRSRGGFDPEFISPDQLEMPILIAKINGKNMVAFPFSKAAKLGEYPLHLKGLKGINLLTTTVQNVPDSRGKPSEFVISSTIDLDDTDKLTEMSIELNGTWALYFRSIFQKITKKEQDELIQKVLTQLDKSNALDQATVENIDKPGEQLTIRLTMKNTDNLIERKGESLLTLNGYFDTFFESIVAERTIPINSSHGYTQTEVIRFVGGSDKVNTENIKTNKISNKLFKSSVSTEQIGRDFLIKRTVTINNTTVPKEFIPSIYQDLQILNSLPNQSVTF